MTSEVENISGGVNKMSVNDEESNERGRRRNDEPIMVKRGETGTVKWFSFKSGYGFIAIDNSDEEVFVHSSAIVTLRKVFCVLHEGDRVEFDVIQGMKGLEAIAVTGIGGRKVGGVRFGDRGGPRPGGGPRDGEKRASSGGRRRRTTSQGSVEKGNENGGGDSGAENHRGGGRGGPKPNGRSDRPRKPRGSKRSGEKFVDAKGSPEGEN
jgi:cold shock CspA family protein